MSQITKNQHYIPRCVLKHFANAKGQVQELMIEKGHQFSTHYEKSMTENNTYEHPELEINFLEKEFCEFEDEFAPKLVEIIRLLNLNETSIVDMKQRMEQIINTIIIFYYRSGALLHELSFQQKDKHDRLTLMLDNILRSTYINELGNTVTKYYSFSILKSENSDFLLSDQYISTAALKIKSRFGNVSNRHLGLRDVIMLVPLSSKYYIAYYDGNIPNYIKPNEINVLSDSEVTEINRLIINNSYVKCVGLNKETLSCAKENFVYASPSSITMGYETGAVAGATLKKEVFYYNSDQELWEFFTSHRWPRYKDLGRNDHCLCGSKKKFKNCCIDIYQGSSRIMDEIISSQKNPNFFHKYIVDPRGTVERPLAQFYKK